MIILDEEPARQADSLWNGFNHVALVTPDLDATLRFYQDVLGMRVLWNAAANPHHGRHAMISPGGGGLGLHFFEEPDAEIFRFPDGVPATLRFLPGALQHISLTVATEEAGLALRARLERQGIPVTSVMEQGPVRIFLFPDPGGMLLEAAWFHADARHP
jgi:catechol 2,3-dioxygenase-like lactoylglutathione lyase family enzyme